MKSYKYKSIYKKGGIDESVWLNIDCMLTDWICADMWMVCVEGHILMTHINSQSRHRDLWWCFRIKVKATFVSCLSCPSLHSWKSGEVEVTLSAAVWTDLSWNIIQSPVHPCVIWTWQISLTVSGLICLCQVSAPPPLPVLFFLLWFAEHMLKNLINQLHPMMWWTFIVEVKIKLLWRH